MVGRNGVTGSSDELQINRSFYLGLLLLLRFSRGIVITDRKGRDIGFSVESGSSSISNTILKKFNLTMRDFAMSCGLWFYNSGGCLDKPALQIALVDKDLASTIETFSKFTYTEWKHVKSVLTKGKFRYGHNCWIEKNGSLHKEVQSALSRLFKSTGGRFPLKSEWNEAGLRNFNDILNSYCKKSGLMTKQEWLTSVGISKDAEGWEEPLSWPKVPMKIITLQS